MNGNDKLINAILDLGLGMKELREEMKGVREEMKCMRKEQVETNIRLDKLEKLQAKTNIELGEMRLSYMRIDKRLEETNNRLEKSEIRIDKRLEETNNRLDELSKGVNKLSGVIKKVPDYEKRINRLEQGQSPMGK